MNKFSGIDLHSNNSVVVVSDDSDRVIYQRRLPNDLDQIRAALAPHREELVGVVIEATFNWYRYFTWLFQRLPLAKAVDDYDALPPWKMPTHLR